jgi:TM2 domain-containing membrane protein YozV
MIGTGTTVNWPLVAILCAVLAGASFLGWDHVLAGEVVAGIYTAVLTAVGVGHFASNGNSSNG